ncbi:type VI secretion system contractile sheath domain-containing protein [Microbulbifer thermotolerans]|uniref:TssC1 N-terminal domain-containing protein n=1 Tax=Microbulbifer thermotolerans TaxID=252514 RepID=A0A143HJD4_MICTH|nr:type VI secretion system contractile sheath large subunit [Microbulbifer thermotolerans]AMX01382.1 hypothetical protein A3224_01215 [Microbulbifer thermotolerans]
MNRATINSGEVVFGDGQAEGIRHSCDEVLKVVILGDFSGRASRRQCDPETLAQREAYRLDKDSFETLFERLSVRLQLPTMEQPLSLLEFDDLHPDYLYSRLPLFRRFIDLERRLLNPREFESAAAELRQWQPQLQVSEPQEEAQSFWDALLSGAQNRNSEGDGSALPVDRLIKEIVAPYVQAKPDQRQESYLQALREAVSGAMRNIMHHSDFRQLEASWRSLHLLLRRIDGHPGLSLHLIDVSKEELLADFAKAENDLEKSQIFKCLVERETAAGSRPYNLIVGDFYIADDERDLHMLIDLSTIAEAAGSALLLGGDIRLAGCPGLAGASDPDDWQYPLSQVFLQNWQAIREYSASAHVALAGPRFMLRLPYGADSATTECFDFEELTADHGHNYYLWGNSVYLLALAICQQFSQSGKLVSPRPATFDNLPLHVRRLPQGRWLTPCAEALLSDRAAARFQATGISTLRSVQDRDQILLPKVQSLAGGELRGPWSR